MFGKLVMPLAGVAFGAEMEGIFVYESSPIVTVECGIIYGVTFITNKEWHNGLLVGGMTPRGNEVGEVIVSLFLVFVIEDDFFTIVVFVSDDDTERQVSGSAFIFVDTGDGRTIKPIVVEVEDFHITYSLSQYPIVITRLLYHSGYKKSRLELVDVTDEVIGGPFDLFLGFGYEAFETEFSIHTVPCDMVMEAFSAGLVVVGRFHVTGCEHEFFKFLTVRESNTCVNEGGIDSFDIVEIDNGPTRFVTEIGIVNRPTHLIAEQSDTILPFIPDFVWVGIEYDEFDLFETWVFLLE